MDDENRGLRQVREEEGIPDLEDETEQEEDFARKRNVAEERTKIDINSSREEVMVEDVDEEGIDDETGTVHQVTDSQANSSDSFQVSKAQTSGHIGSSRREVAIENQVAKVETPGFTAYVDRRPTSMAEVNKNLDAQFTIVCNAASDVSALLEAKKAQYLLMSNEISASILLNPVALFRSASRSSSSRFLANPSSIRNEDNECTSDPSEEQCRFSSCHRSTLEGLYAWEKKLYEEVKSGERVRIAYVKKCQQFKNRDVKGGDPSSVDKTKAAIRDLHTQITVSIHSIEAISKRIETLRDEELHLQLLDLMQGYRNYS